LKIEAKFCEYVRFKAMSTRAAVAAVIFTLEIAASAG
jgi:hypothetical protein